VGDPQEKSIILHSTSVAVAMAIQTGKCFTCLHQLAPCGVTAYIFSKQNRPVNEYFAMAIQTGKALLLPASVGPMWSHTVLVTCTLLGDQCMNMSAGLCETRVCLDLRSADQCWWTCCYHGNGISV